MAHLDAVPIVHEHQWIHPPFGGVIADGYIWGRGTMDNKVWLFSLLKIWFYLLLLVFKKIMLVSFGEPSVSPFVIFKWSIHDSQNIRKWIIWSKEVVLQLLFFKSNISKTMELEILCSELHWYIIAGISHTNSWGSWGVVVIFIPTSANHLHFTGTWRRVRGKWGSALCCTIFRGTYQLVVHRNSRKSGYWHRFTSNQQQGVSFEFILDEGLIMLDSLIPGAEDVGAAVIGIAEKGYLTLNLTYVLNWTSEVIDYHF
jgi:hypothetical protein